MKRFLPLTVFASLALVACTVDTTGLTPDIHNEPHPQSNANAAVTVVEYADLQCPACRAATTLIVTPLLESHGSTMRYEFRHFPLRSTHRFALISAEAAECAGDQGKFWEFVDIVYANQQDLKESQLAVWAADLGLDTTLFNRCVQSGIKRDGVLAQYEEGDALGVSGTPTFFVNGKQVQATIEALRAAVDEANAGMIQKL